MATLLSFVIIVPPLGAVNQPANVYPTLVAVGSSPYVERYVTDLLAAEALPPFALNVTVYEDTVQCA